jgi:hypothetical protein
LKYKRSYKTSKLGLELKRRQIITEWLHGTGYKTTIWRKLETGLGWSSTNSQSL